MLQLHICTIIKSAHQQLELRHPSLALAALGYDVLATDTSEVVSSVLLPNVQNNTQRLYLPGSIQVRTLDWTVSPSDWTWESEDFVASTLPKPDNFRGGLQNPKLTLNPPFDIIITSDTVYNAELTIPLLRTIHHILYLSQLSMRGRRTKHAPLPIYVALENRDPEQIASFFREAREQWSLSAKKVPVIRLKRALSHGGLGDWNREDWKGVEIWQMGLTKEDKEDVRAC